MSTNTINTKHTPWVINSDTVNNEEALSIFDQRSDLIASVYEREHAKLIAAAPELLEALKKVEQWIAEDSVSPTMHLSTIREKFIKPAILKATS